MKKKIHKSTQWELIAAIIPIVLSVILAISSGVPLLESLCCNYPKLTASAIIILIGCFLSMIIFLSFEIFMNKNKEPQKSEKKLNRSYKPFVLVFDDEIDTLKDIDEFLAKECNTVLLSDMTHECLADRFDIIIGDINNIGYGYKHKNASSILNEILRNDPYKLVIAITNDKSQAIDLDSGIKCISKDGQNKYLLELLRNVKKFRSSIIELDKFWKKWKEDNKKLGETKEVKEIKKRFYNHFNDFIE